MKHATIPRKVGNHVHDVPFLEFHRDLDGVAVHRGADRLKLRKVSSHRFRHAIESHLDFVNTLREKLKSGEISSRHLAPFVDDENVIAELFGFAKNLRGQNDGAAFFRFGAQAVHHLPLQDRIHPRRKLVEKKYGCIHQERLRDLHAAAETAAEILHFFLDLAGKLKFVDQTVGPAFRCGGSESLETRVSQEIIAHRKKQLGRGFLNDGRNPAADLDRLLQHVKIHYARRRSEERRVGKE